MLLDLLRLVFSISFYFFCLLNNFYLILLFLNYRFWLLVLCALIELCWLKLRSLIIEWSSLSSCFFSITFFLLIWSFVMTYLISFLMFLPFFLSIRWLFLVYFFGTWYYLTFLSGETLRLFIDLTLYRYYFVFFSKVSTF